MKPKRKTLTLISLILITALATGLIPLSIPAAAVGGTSFYASFEASEQQPLKHATVDSYGLRGVGAGVPRIPGDMMQLLQTVGGSGSVTGNEGMAMLADNNPATKWCQTNANWNNEVYVTYTFSQALVARTYLISSANDDFPNNRSRSFYSWTIYGSNVSATSGWVELDKQTAQTYSANFQDKVYTFENETAYRYYKLTLDQLYGSGSGARSGTLQASDWSLGIGSGPQLLPPGETSAEFMATYTISPSVRWNARSQAGFTGMRALGVAGEHTQDGPVYANNKIYEFGAGEEIEVVATTQLSYLIAPSFNIVENALNPEYPVYPSQHVAIDLLFDDGARLSQLPCYDSHGVKLDAQSQFEGRCLWEGQWNKITANIGAVAAGKKIKQILVSYANKDGKQGTSFEAFIDDVRIVEKRSDDPTAPDFNGAFDAAGKIIHPSILTEGRRGTMSSYTFTRGFITTNVNVPFAFNFWGPQTNSARKELYTSLYSYLGNNNSENKSILRSISANHQPSFWIDDRGNFNTMASRETNVNTNAIRSNRNYTFTHENEVSHAYYYKVALDNGMVGEVAPTDHAAAIRWTFPTGPRHFLFDSHIRTENPDGAVVTWLTGADGNREGWFRTDDGTHANGQRRLYAYVKFDTPVTDYGTTVNTSTNRVHYVSFGSGTGATTVTMYVATSYIGWEQARKNLELEIGEMDFDGVKAAAQQEWDDILNTVQILDFAPAGWDGNVDTLPPKTLDELVTMYSNMVRSFSWPSALHENTGTKDAPVIKHASQYRGTSSAPTIVDGVMYTNNGFWDTYKSSWQAYAQLVPVKTGELLNGLVNHYMYNSNGFVPRWVAPGGHNAMVGTSSDVVFGTAAIRGVDFDVRRAYESALRSASVVSGSMIDGGRSNINRSMFTGFTGDTGLSWGLEGYINDFGTARMAEILGYTDDAVYLTNRATNYVKYWNPNEITDIFFGNKIPGGWLRAKNWPNAETGVANWRSSDADFNPYSWTGGVYEEASAWQMAFTLADGMGMQNLLGGSAGMEKRLDDIFTGTQSYYPTRDGIFGNTIHEILETAACKLGQYNHGNQPAHQVPFFYNFTDSPWKTQHYTRDIMDRLYTGWEIGQGYPGDEDNGEMSSWYVMTALGLSPTALGWDEFYLTAPYFSHMKINRDDGTVWEIKAPGVGMKNKYIQSMTIEGAAHDKNYVTQKELTTDLNNDGVVTFEFVMGDTPGGWGAGEYSKPPSLTAPGVTPQPLADLTKGYTNRQAEGDEILISSGAGGTANNLFDNHAGSTGTSTTNKYVSTSFTSGMYFGYKFAKPKVVHGYTISVGNTVGRNPRNWVLEASNDGIAWETLDTRTDVKFGMDTRSLGLVGTKITNAQALADGGTWTHYTKPFGIINTKAFTHYRIRVTAINSGSTIEITELEFLGFEDPDAAYTAFKWEQGYGLNMVNGVDAEIGFMLPRKPVKDVTVTLDSPELGIDEVTYVFTPDNWFIAQKLPVSPAKSTMGYTVMVSVKAASEDFSYNCDITVPATVISDYTFQTEFEPETLRLAEGGDMEIHSTVRNNNAAAGDPFFVIAALYAPGNGRLVYVDQVEVTTPAVNEYVQTALSVPIPADSTDYVLKVFYWDKNYVPLVPAEVMLWEPPPPEPPTNLALFKPVRASAAAQSGHDAAYVNDGNMGTRWGAGASGGETTIDWIIIDLEQICDICQVSLTWEDAYSREYAIQISSADKPLASLVDSDFTELYRVTSGAPGLATQTIDPPQQARFVRMYSTRRGLNSFGTWWGISIFEFEIYGWKKV